MVALLALRDLLARQSLTDGQKVVLLRIGAGILVPQSILLVTRGPTL